MENPFNAVVTASIAEDIATRNDFYLISKRLYFSVNQGRAVSLSTFVMDWGYDDNKMFLKLDELKQVLLLYAILLII